MQSQYVQSFTLTNTNSLICQSKFLLSNQQYDSLKNPYEIYFNSGLCEVNGRVNDDSGLLLLWSYSMTRKFAEMWHCSSGRNILHSHCHYNKLLGFPQFTHPYCRVPFPLFLFRDIMTTSCNYSKCNSSAMETIL